MNDSVDFRTLMQEARRAGRLDYIGDNLFHQAARIAGPKTTAAAAAFLEALVASAATDNEIWEMWFRTGTYVPKRAEARPFTKDVIDLLRNPRTPSPHTDS